MNAEQRAIRTLFRKLESSECHPFPKSDPIPRSPAEHGAPDHHGVYIIYGANERVLHVGKSSRGKRGLRQRLGNHWAGRTSFVDLYFKGDRDKIRRCKFRYLKVDDARVRALLEAYATGYLCPAHIGLNEMLRISN